VRAAEPDHPSRVVGIDEPALGEELGAPLAHDATVEVHARHVRRRFEQMQVDPGRRHHCDRIDVDPRGVEQRDAKRCCEQADRATQVAADRDPPLGLATTVRHRVGPEIAVRHQTGNPCFPCRHRLRAHRNALIPGPNLMGGG
jgi:hypothetical protein